MAFASTFNTPGGIQTDVSGASAGFPGAPGGMDMSWLMDLAKRRAQQKLLAGDIENQGAELALQQARKATRPHLTLNRAAPAPAPAPYQMGAGQRMQQARALVPEQTARQRAISSQGGLSSLAYRDSMRQMQEKDLLGVPQTNYTGFTDLVQALAGSSAAAVDAAGHNQLQQAEQNSPIEQARQQQMLASRMYPGMIARLYGQG